MEDVVWLMENAKLRHRRYLVLVIQQTVARSDRVRQALLAETHDIGRQMRDRGAVVVPYEEQIATTFLELTAKPWRDEIRARMDATLYPFLVILETDFSDFDPGRDRSAIIWLEDFADRPDRVWEATAKLTRLVTDEEADLFDVLAEVERAARAQERAEAVERYVDARIPLIPGFVSLKASALLAGLVRRL
jgi:hypothetical protein